MTYVRKEVIGNATLYLGDCLEILPTLGGFDAVIADPPYGSNTNTRGASRARGVRGTTLKTITPTARDWPAVEGDDRPFDPTPWLALNVPTILWGANWYGSRLPDASRWLVWDKRVHTPPDDNADVELAWTNLGGPARMYRHLWRGLCREGEENIANGPKLHPTQKPVALMRWCVAMTSGTVLDGYMGCGPIGVATVEAGRGYIGCEKVPTYFDLACERIDQAQRQGRLFA